ncbi:MAG: DUF4430 domain-containing protein [Methanomassiliicoccales archaeon]|nr:DUF4430 domain-containing protein [Methanomassiliicoccales archaeon]
MKLTRKDALLAAVAAMMIVFVTAFVLFTQTGSSASTTTWTVDFADTSSPVSPGNVTTWTYANGSWTVVSVTNGDRSVWMFTNVTSAFACSMSGSTPCTVTIDFAEMPSPFNVGNNTLWTHFDNTWFVSSSLNDGHSIWTLQNVSAQTKLQKGETVTAIITIDFVGTASPSDPGNLTTWTKVNGVWTKSSVPNGGHSIWVFVNVTSKPTCLAQLYAAEGIGGFGDTNSTYAGVGGVLINSIAGLENQMSGGPGWQYYVNGVYASRSCSLYYLSNGDQVVWMYKPLVS